MAAIDLKDAYYSIPIRSLDRYFLRFFGRAPYMSSLAFPMVCHVLRRLLLKSLKTTFLFAQARSHSCRTSWWPLLARTNLWQMCQKFCWHHCIASQIRVGCTSWAVCFHTHPSPHDSILGFVSNSVTMTIQLTRGKTAGFQRVCTELLACPSPSIRQVASVIGKIPSPSQEKGHFWCLDVSIQSC